IGRGVEAEPLRREAAALGVSLQLDDGWASDEEIVAAYAKAAVVVCPSRFEGFGLTPMEGLAMQRAVVASDIPVHREFVGGQVRLFAPDDAAALAQRCVEALAAPGVPSAEPLPELTISACADRLEAAIRPYLS
ncbi:MAG: glycosyltransferase family 4 protein, partial [Gemmatimonadales bacterium]